jgi:hypothetical protein
MMVRLMAGIAERTGPTPCGKSFFAPIVYGNYFAGSF